MTVQLGINPIGWTNDCMGWLGDLILPDTCLAEAKSAGFSGVELGRKLPRQARRLGTMLKRHGLSLASGWYSAQLASRDTKSEIEAMQPHLNLLKALDAPVMVFAETSGEIVNNVGAPMSARPKLSKGDEWRRLGKRFTEVAEYLQDQGVPMVVHHHMGTIVQSAEDIDRLLENSGQEVNLLLDTGHLTYAGGDPVRVARKYGNRIRHVHCKDVRRYALAACNARDVSFSEAVLCGIFTAPGDGIVDYRGVLKALAKVRYKGWLIQEAEQDPRTAHPATYARLGREFLARACAEAGIGIAN